MSRVLPVLVVVAAFAALPKLASAQTDPYDAWSGFGEGSSVSYEMTSEAGGKKTTSKLKLTLTKKEADKVTITMEMEGHAKPFEQVYEKGKKKECPACKKAHKEAGLKETGKEKIKIGDKEIETVTYDITQYGCDEKEAGTSKAWLCKDVPGWAVKAENKGVTTLATVFEKK